MGGRIQKKKEQERKKQQQEQRKQQKRQENTQHNHPSKHQKTSPLQRNPSSIDQDNELSRSKQRKKQQQEQRQQQKRQENTLHNHPSKHQKTSPLQRNPSSIDQENELSGLKVPFNSFKFKWAIIFLQKIEEGKKLEEITSGNKAIDNVLQLELDENSKKDRYIFQLLSGSLFHDIMMESFGIPSYRFHDKFCQICGGREYFLGSELIKYFNYEEMHTTLSSEAKYTSQLPANYIFRMYSYSLFRNFDSGDDSFENFKTNLLEKEKSELSLFFMQAGYRDGNDYVTTATNALSKRYLSYIKQCYTASGWDMEKNLLQNPFGMYLNSLAHQDFHSGDDTFEASKALLKSYPHVSQCRIFTLSMKISQINNCLYFSSRLNG